MEAVRLACFEAGLGLPDEDHIVLGLIGCGHLDEMQVAEVKAGHRLHPHARALVVTRFRILVGGKRPVALHQGPRARALHSEDTMAELPVRVLKRTVVEVSALKLQQKPIAVMHLRAEIQGLRMGAFAEPEHRGKRSQPELLDGAAQGDFRIDVHDGLDTRGDGELIGPGDALPFQQGPRPELLGILFRALEVKFGEIGELLRHARQPAVDGEPPGGEPVGRVGRDGT